MTFSVVLEPEPDGGFFVYVPVLPEVHTQGRTFEEAVARARDAIELAVLYRSENGEEIPPSDGDALLVRVTLTPAA